MITKLIYISSAIRRQKELELQILTGPIRGWEGDELITMGEIRHMGSVAVGKDVSYFFLILFKKNKIILFLARRPLFYFTRTNPFNIER